LALELPQSFDRLAHERRKADPTLIKMINNCRSHTRIPEFLQVIRYAGDGLIVALAHEKTGLI
jgi:hypothetical protein